MSKMPPSPHISVPGANSTHASTAGVTASSASSGGSTNTPKQIIPREWHSRVADLEDRKLMARRIYNVLLKNNAKTPANWEPQEVARRLEQSLYYSAECKADYIDLNTLRVRLQAVMDKSRKQASQKQQIQRSQSNSILDEIEREAEQQENTGTANASAATSSLIDGPARGGTPKQHKIAVLQQRLMLLKHARLCKSAPGTCLTAHCMTFRKILAHIAVCKQEPCTVSGCTMAKQLLSHYKMCRNFGCQLCNSIRKPMDKVQQTEVLRRQQERLCLLRHASICQQNCELPYCSEMKALWTHICKCTDRQCTFNHCISSRYVLSHFKECRNAGCEVCAPVRRAIKVSDVSGGITGSDAVSRKRSAQAANLSTADAEAQRKRQIILATPKDISYLDSLSVEDLSSHIQSLRYNFTGHAAVSQLKALILPILKKLMDHQFGWVFSSPVDPVALQIPDYFEIIKCPMDLGTIKKRLETSSYYTSIDAIAADVSLTFENCIAYNDDANEFNILARDLLEHFQKDIKELRERLDKELDKKLHERREEMCQLCAGDSFKFAPSMLFCNGPCRGRIRRHTHYYSDSKNEFHWCTPCFKDMKETSPISITSGTIYKKQLLKQKNSDVVEEPWVECDYCKKWYHQICALFNERNNAISGDEDQFLCPSCVRTFRESGKLKPSDGLNAKRLPHSRLSLYLENRVVAAIRVAADEEERRIGKPMDMYGLDINGLAIREVLSVEKKVEVKDRMKKIFQEHKQALEFTYRSRCICVFQKIDGVDVLLFTLYLQEYGDKVPEPNRRRIYISYLDSVNFFQPKKFRTLMHQEVIVGALEDAKNRGYHFAHIWSCPPLKGDDYIFFCKPENQKIPKAARLRQWYIKMLRKAQDSDTLYTISNLYADYYQKMKSANELPYFAGDYWPGLAEELLKQLEEKPEKKEETDDKASAKKKQKKQKKTKNSVPAPVEATTEEENPDILMQRFKPILEPQKDDFFVIQLRPVCEKCTNPIPDGKYWIIQPVPEETIAFEPTTGKVAAAEVVRTSTTKTRNEGKIPAGNRPATPLETKKGLKIITDEYFCAECYTKHKTSIEAKCKGKKDLKLFSLKYETPILKTDADPIMPCEIFDTRESFLTYCQSNHCQFDQLRRAKHSSMMILYHLFNQGTTGFTYSCSSCETKLERGNRWNCSICAGYNLCDRCKVKTKHEHSLHPIQCIPPAAAKKSGSATSAQPRRQVDPALLKLIDHASRCINASCQPNCLRMRALLKHGATCEAKISGKCQTCRRILGLLKIHAQLCNKAVCSVPRCKDIRAHLARLKLQQKQLQERRQTSLLEGSRR